MSNNSRAASGKNIQEEGVKLLYSPIGGSRSGAGVIVGFLAICVFLGALGVVLGGILMGWK